jgi:hypothetical protein
MRDYTKDESIPLPVAALLNDIQRSVDTRSCTCHPDDWPQHIPCQHKYAFKDCAIEAIRQNLAMIK